MSGATTIASPAAAAMPHSTMMRVIGSCRINHASISTKNGSVVLMREVLLAVVR
jgi:hypothetical protein